METAVRTRKVGGSLIVTLPKEIVDEEGIKEGELVKVRIRRLRKDGFGMFKTLTHFLKEDKLDTHE
ncbi:AbrB/MazE/SpoVT family DNA-binding domain-containing protein [Candidatus Woesearchaeota archaeon]|nr:AbrB/MazE/SpoVT family DNA-binding domain-containing protein [Candidatus Woesearchaeota archaeon]